ncbi:MAG: DUF1722 domain-containing protein [Desulfovibrio sp.]|nr:MAG: DUF1722 domain-containing protein [Desulfovibrio sp.]
MVDDILDAHRDTSAPEEIRLGIARCLLGDKVRYDGGHKLNHYLAEELGRYVTFVPVCPELECGMGVPREPMRLEGDPGAPRLVTHHSKQDLTEQMLAWGRDRVEELAGEGLCGYVFKTKSPSSGMARIKVHQEKGGPKHTGVGLWARLVMERYPLLPCEDEGRLNDPKLRENFIEQVFLFKRLRTLLKQGPNPKELIEFHTRHKLLVRAHDEQGYRALGKIVARAGQDGMAGLLREYVELLAASCKRMATPRKHANVLYHALGYFKRNLSPDEKQEAVELIELYRRERLPLIVPVTLINHFARKYGETYLLCQHYFHPHPMELMLRNHV